jgi:hypothetical protein
MVSFTLPVVAPTPWMKDIKLSRTGRKEALKRLEAIYEELCRKVEPLAKVSTRADLDAYLRLTLPDINTLSRRVTSIVIDLDLDFEVFERASRAFVAEFEERREGLADLLGPEDAERLMAAVESHAGLTGWFLSRMKALLAGDAKAFYRPPVLSREAEEAAEKAWAAFFTIQSVLKSRVSSWTPHGLHVLVEAADEYMATIEDEFLAAKPGTPSHVLTGDAVGHVLKLPA